MLGADLVGQSLRKVILNVSVFLAVVHFNSDTANFLPKHERGMGIRTQ